MIDKKSDYLIYYNNYFASDSNNIDNLLVEELTSDIIFVNFFLVRSSPFPAIKAGAALYFYRDIPSKMKVLSYCDFKGATEQPQKHLHQQCGLLLPSPSYNMDIPVSTLLPFFAPERAFLKKQVTINYRDSACYNHYIRGKKRY